VAVVVVTIALSLGRDVFVPVMLSIVLAAALQPLVRRLERLRLPTPAAAAVVVLSAVGLLVLLGMALERPLRDMADDAPRSVALARQRINAIAAQVRRITGGSAPAPARPDSSRQKRGGNPAAGAQPSPASGSSAAPSPALGRVFGITTSLVTELVEEVLLVFFMLAAGKTWLKKLARMARRPERKRLWPEIAGEVHDVVSRYLFVTLLINAGQAIVIGLIVWGLGLPAPFLWAVLTFVAEWIPYLGGLAMIVLLLIAGLAADQPFAHAILAPIAYLVVTTLQNNLVSPIAYGRGLRLNPTAILVAVMFWWMLWGVAGAFLAVPILASLRVLATRLPALEPIGVLLEE
jgi:predicted PurR-regulated permease PerM